MRDARETTGRPVSWPRAAAPRTWMAAAALMAVLAACGSGDGGSSGANTTGVAAVAPSAVPAAGTTDTAAVADTASPVASSSATEVPSSDVRATDVPASEPLASEVPASEVPASEVPATADGAPPAVTIGPSDRPATLFVPAGYEPATPAPLVVLLHGYTANGEGQDAYFGMRAEADARGYLYVLPDGTLDPIGNQFWDATDACCDFAASGVDDSAYLAGLIGEVQTGWAVDPGRIYVVGHSNGGFMSYRMACDHADLVAAIVSLAGATFDDPAACAPSQPVSVAQVHGTDDQVVAYAGGHLYGDPTYPSAPETVATWAAYDGCGDWVLAAGGGTLDIDAGLAGAETSVATAVDCPAGIGVELWTIGGGSHIPALGPGFLPAVFDFLEAHART